ncbi:MAG: portal protein [Verrucomicrobia bacterium]|nr:MAG: portal protein [Verrucomicrobiota bacterium]
MVETTFVNQLAAMVAAAAVAGALMSALRLPGILGYLVAGLVLGPWTGWVQITPSVQGIAETGIVLLLFLVGLELSLDKLKGLGWRVAAAGGGQMVATLAAGWLVARVLGFTGGTAWFLGAALTFSSTVVVVKVLEEKRQLDTLAGRLAVGVLLQQDLAVIVLLTLAGVLGSGAAFTAGALAKKLVFTFGGLGFLVAAVLWTAARLLPKPFAWAARSPTTLLVWSLGWCFLIVMAAHALHLSPEVGGFLAGVGLAQLPWNHDLRRRVHPLMNFFVALFFVSFGIQMPLGALEGRWMAAVALAGFAVVGKLALSGGVFMALRYDRRTAAFGALALAQISEFSLVLAVIAEQVGWVGRDVMAVVGMVGLISMPVSACLMSFQEGLWWRLGRWRWLHWLPRGTPMAPEDRPAARPEGHVIVVGMNTLGRAIVRRLHERGVPVVAIDTDPAKLEGLPARCLLGNAEYLSVLEEANLAGARLLVSALQIEPTNDLLAHRAREAGVPAAIHVVDLSVVDNLLLADVRYLIIPKVDGIKLQNRLLQEAGLLPS